MIRKVLAVLPEEYELLSVEKYRIGHFVNLKRGEESGQLLVTKDAIYADFKPHPLLFDGYEHAFHSVEELSDFLKRKDLTSPENELSYNP